MSSRRSYSESVKSAESVSTEDITDKIPDNDDDDDDIDALLKDNDISWVSLHKKVSIGRKFNLLPLAYITTVKNKKIVSFISS